MKKRTLNYSPFKTYDGSGLIFVKPFGSKVYRLLSIDKAYHTTEVIDLLLQHGQIRKGNIFIFKKDEAFMSGLCFELSEMGVFCATLEADTDLLN